MLENDKILAPTGGFTPFYLDVEYNQQAYDETVDVAYGYYAQYTTSGNIRTVSRNMFSRRLTSLGYKTKVCKLGKLSIRKIMRAGYE